MTSRQPKALYVLFLTELWERFGYYTMVSLLALYLTSQLGMTDERAYLVVGAYLSLAFLTTIAGGFAADRILGFGRAILAGAVLMSLGYLVLAVGGGPVINAALALLVAGMGLFKANVSALLGRFYDEDDPRRSSGFILFYMGINVGGLLGSLSAGVIAENFGYPVAFALAGGGKALALVTYLVGRRWLDRQDAPPETAGGLWRWQTAAAATLGIIVLAALLLARPELVGVVVAVAGAAGVAAYVALIMRQPPPVRRRLFVHLVLVAASVVFWAVYQQYTTSVTLFTEREVARTIFGWEVPASEFTALNSLFIILLGPVLAALWPWLSGRGYRVDDIVKFAGGLALIGIAYWILDLGVFETAGGAKTGLGWIVLFYLVFTLAEMFLSPVGLALTTALAPRALAGMAMGIWFLSIAAAEYLAGIIAQLADITSGTSPAAEVAIYREAFFIYGGIGIAAAAVLAVFVPRLIRMVKQTK